MNGTRRESPSSGFGATREDFAAGDVLVRFPLAAIPRLLILSPIAKPGWHGRADGTATRALFPGSAVRFEGRFYEVRRVSPNPRDGTTRYELWPWEDRFILRETFEYTREECERVAAFVRAVKRKQAAAHSLAWVLPLVGLLPARLQLAIEEEYGLPAARATFWSALILLGLSTLAVGVGAQCAASLMLGGPKPLPISLFAMHVLPLSGYLGVESAVRYRLSFPAGIPAGSAPIALPISFVLWIRDAFRSRAGKPSPQKKRSEPVTDDEIHHLPDGRLEILSVLDKPHWGTRTAIHHGDTWWMAIEREAPAASTDPASTADRRWRFVLDAWPEHLLIQDPAEYSPDEVHGLVYDAARARHRPTVESLGALFGLLSAAEQARLAEVYGHDARSRTGWSILAIALTAGFVLVIALGRIVTVRGALAEGLIAAAAVFLLFEAGQRTSAWLRGRVTPSILAPLVRPLAKRVLDLGPAA